MTEYFHVYKDGELNMVTLSLSVASATAQFLKKHVTKDVKVKSYLLDPKVLEAMSTSVDELV